MIGKLFQNLGLPYNIASLEISMNDKQKVESICKGISTRLMKHDFIRSEKEILEAVEILEKKSWEKK